MKNEKKLSNNNNVSFKLISNNQKIENDKLRIKSKFNFNLSRTSTNTTVFHSSLTTQQNSCLFSDKIQKIKNKINHHNNQMLNQKISYSTQKAKKSIKKLNSNINQKSNYSNENEESSDLNDDINIKGISMYNKKSQIKENIISNITYNNYDKYYTDNSSIISDSQNNNLLESLLKTQSIKEGINCSDSNESDNKYNNLNRTENDCTMTLKKGNEDGTGTLKDNEILKSFNNTSFSGSSRTSELNRDNIYIRSGENFSNGDNIRINNNNNYIIRNYNNLNNVINNNKSKKISTGETFLQEIFVPFKTYNYERKRTEVNGSGLLGDDEYNQNRQKMLKNVSKYYFIEDIIIKNNNYISLSLDKFKKLKNNAKYKTFSFIFDNYKIFLNTSKSMRNIIINMLEEKFGGSINDFKDKYKNILLLDSHQFNIYKYTKQKEPNKKYIKFCLYLKAKIIPNNIYINKFGDIGFELSYSYTVRNLKNNYNKSNRTDISNETYKSKDHIQEEFLQIYKFDLRKNKNYPIWLCSERDEVFNNSGKMGGGTNYFMSRILKKDELYQKHLIYSSPIINVNENDYIVFRIDLIEENNIIENIKFNNVIIESIYTNYFHKNSFKLEQKFDNMRDCENEIVINIWHDECGIKDYCKDNTITNYQNFIQKLKDNFQEYFEIIETKFDMSKFIFIRMTMKAKKIGILKNSIFSNKDIKIVDKNISLTKECIPINLVNTFSMNKYLVIKQDTIVDFYLME